MTITGTNFSKQRSFKCRFGSILPVNAVWMSGTNLNCISPASLSSNIVSIDITDNDQDYTQSSIRFSYVTGFTIASIQPTHGKFNGGTMVTIFGHELGNVTSCAFGANWTPAISRTVSSIVCESPGGIPGDTVDIALSLNNVDLSSTSYQFEYVYLPMIDEISPASKPVSGGGVVATVIGRFFRNSTWLRFGSSDPISTTYVSENEILVHIPPAWNNISGSVEVSAMTNGLEFSTRSFSFSYDPIITVTAVSPNHGGISGGYDITVFGTGFVNIHSCKCRFGNNAPSTCTFLSTSAVMCSVPMMDKISMNAVEVSANGADFSSDNVLLCLLQDPTIYDIVPKIGPQSGNITVALHVAGIQNSTALRCQFSASIIVPAVYLN